MPDRLSAADRIAVLGELETTAETLNRIAVALDGQDATVPAEILEQAARSIAAACWILQAPVRVYMPGGIATWPDGRRER